MRPTAYKLKIEDLNRGEYKRSADGAEPSHFLTPWNNRVTRARTMGTVVDKFVRDDRSYGALRLDDGSGTIRVRFWSNDIDRIDSFKIGDVIDVVGRVKEFEGEVYLTPELVMPVEDPNWELVRDLEIIKSRKKALARGAKPEMPPKLEPRTLSVEMPTPTKVDLEEPEPMLPDVSDEIKDRVLLAVKGGNSGEGTPMSEVVSKTNVPEPDVENAVEVLLAEGKIFEPKAGKFKTVV